jgi:hypothetical protein
MTTTTSIHCAWGAWCPRPVGPRDSFYRVIPNVDGQHGRLANLCNQRVESVWNRSLMLMVKPPVVQGS